MSIRDGEINLLYRHTYVCMDMCVKSAHTGM